MTEPEAAEDESIIYPPPDIKNICDKTAAFVAKNGPGFEDRIREKELHNPKFCFLNSNDPYYKYYLWKIKQIKDETPQQESLPLSAMVKKQKKEKPQPAPVVPVIPPMPPPNEYFVDMPTISKQDLEIIKLTAQFTAYNSTLFMSNLGQREQKNYQFDFLRPSHSFYPFFTKLVEQYTKIRLRPRNLYTDLEANINSRYQILDKIMKKVDYESWVLQEKQKAELEADAEKVAFATIDWHDFVVVETIEFLEADDRAVLPPPLSLSELESMTLEQRKAMMTIEAPKIDMEEDIEVDEEDIEVDDDVSVEMDLDEEESPVKMAPSAPTRTTYVPKVGRHVKAQLSSVCTICGATVKDADMPEHVKMELADPRFRERRAELLAKEKGSNLVGGDNLAQNLQKMTNFLGTGKDDVTLSEKIAFEKEKMKDKPKVIWDGHKGSAALAAAKMQAISEHQPPPPTGPPPVGPVKKAPAPPQTLPDPKRQKTINPNAFMLSIMFQDRPIILDDLTPLWTVSQLKARLVAPSGMAAGKQKLITSSNVVLKNTMTLHQAGLTTGAILTLQKK